MTTYKTTSSESASCYFHTDNSEHDYFEDATNTAIKEKTRWKINDLYNAILATYDYDEEQCLYAHPELLTAYGKSPHEILLAMRKAYNSRIWTLFADESFSKSLSKEITDFNNKSYQQIAREMKSATAKITLERFGNVLDDYKLDDYSLRWIVNDLFTSMIILRGNRK